MLVEKGTAHMSTDGVTWWYAAQKDLAPDQLLWITVTAADQPGHRTTKVMRHLTGA
jgi:hypothetical protein